MRKKFLKRLIAIATVATLTVGSFSTAYGRERPRDKDIIWHQHMDEFADQSDDSQIEDNILNDEQNETSIESVDVVYENFELGNTTSKILKGGLCASYGELDYYAQNDGVLLIGEDREGIITTDVVTDINVMEDTLYYVTVQDEKFIIKKSDLYCEESEVIYESDDEIEMMYVINNEEIVYLVENNIYKLDIATGEQTIVNESSNTSLFIPTQYGFILGADTEDKTKLYVNEKELFDVHNFYVEDEYFIYDYESETKQVILEDIFRRKFERKAYEQEFNLHGKYNIYDLLSSDENEYCEECLNNYQSSKDNNPTVENISTYLTLSETSTVAEYSASTYSLDSLTEGQKNIVKRASQMVEIVWTPLNNIVSWRNDPKNTFIKGVEYTGAPYGWCTTRGSWLGYNTSLCAFSKYVEDSTSLLYTNTAYDSGEGAIAPYYSNDCSTFLSYCWNLPARKSTVGLVDEVAVTMITTSDTSVLEVGDCLNKKGSHVVLVTEKTYDEAGNLTGYVIAEQTPPKAKSEEKTLEQIKSEYFNNGYIAYRYDKRNEVTYEHCCSVPIDGDTCAECNYNSAVASTMNISDYNYPSSLSVGQSFSIYGDISSNYYITKVLVEVYKVSGPRQISISANPYTKRYNVSNLDAQIKFGTLSDGTYLYRVTATDRQGSKILINKQFTVGTGGTSSTGNVASTLSISSYTYPSSLVEGQSFSVKGAVTSNYTITNVTVKVYDSTGKTHILVSANPGSKSYNISSLDSKIKFGILSAGSYAYQVIATDTKGTKTLLSRSFVVYSSSVVSTLKVSSYTYPTSITQGSSFGLKGTVTSNYYIKNVTIGVYNTSGTALITASATPLAKSYSISNLDAKITFGKLSKGTYVYKIIATDVKGTKVLFSSNFTVK